MGNPETLVTLATQNTGQRLEKTQGQIKNGQYRDTGNIGYTRHRENVRENPRANQEWAIQRTKVRENTRTNEEWTIQRHW
jgi:hypothetical protein